MYVDDGAFVPFYHGLIEAIKSIKQFYIEDDNYPWVEEESIYSERVNYKRFMQIEKDVDVIEFESEVDSCKESLSYIMSNTVNPLEMLYEAEMAEKTAESAEEKLQTGSIGYVSPIESSSDDNDMLDLLDDPETLIKVLKNRGGV